MDKVARRTFIYLLFIICVCVSGIIEDDGSGGGGGDSNGFMFSILFFSPSRPNSFRGLEFLCQDLPKFMIMVMVMMVVTVMALCSPDFFFSPTQTNSFSGLELGETVRVSTFFLVPSFG